MDSVILTARTLREKYAPRPAAAFIGPLLAANNIRLDIWPMQTEKFAGCLWKNGDEWTILLNARQAQPRKLFTLAHELGHYFLHRHLKTHFSCSIFPTGPVSRWEQEANRFAAELLMPAGQVLRLADTSPARAARHFGVSEEALQYRLRSLSAVRSGGGKDGPPAEND